MNQITKMLIESNKITKDFIDGKLPSEVAQVYVSLLNSQIKILNVIVNMYAINSKNKRALDSFNRMNLIDHNTAVDLGLGDPADDKIKCQERNSLITRADCLDFSGTHYEECGGCSYFESTRKLLLGEKGR